MNFVGARPENWLLLWQGTTVLLSARHPTRRSPHICRLHLFPRSTQSTCSSETRLRLTRHSPVRAHLLTTSRLAFAALASG